MVAQQDFQRLLKLQFDKEKQLGFLCYQLVEEQQSRQVISEFVF